jgi:glutaredoxin 3
MMMMQTAEQSHDVQSGVVIYTTLLCPYCHRAKALLRKKGVAFTEIDVGMDPQKRAEMMKRADGRHTVPQIFIGDTHVGGCDDLHELDDRGGLDPLLQSVVR